MSAGGGRGRTMSASGGRGGTVGRRWQRWDYVGMHVCLDAAWPHCWSYQHQGTAELFTSQLPMLLVPRHRHIKQ